ncbi:MAG: hypothetical protein AAFR47_11710 [Pseudomonadota bacterium]
MTAKTPTLTRVAPLALTLGAALLVASCGQEARRAWNAPSGNAITTSDFGNATMNNHLIQTCQAGPGSAQSKYVSKVGGCPGRTLDGKYGQRTYEEYVDSAQPQPQFTRELDP